MKKEERAAGNACIHLVAEFYCTQEYDKLYIPEPRDGTPGQRWKTPVEEYEKELRTTEALISKAFEANDFDDNFDLKSIICEQLKTLNKSVGKPKASLLQLLDESIRHIYSAARIRSVSSDRLEMADTIQSIIDRLELELTYFGQVRRKIEKLQYKSRELRKEGRDDEAHQLKGIIEREYKESGISKGSPPYFDYFIDDNEVKQIILSTKIKTVIKQLNTYNRAKCIYKAEHSDDFENKVITFFDNEYWHQLLPIEE
jgi:hypothetical protein